MYGVGAQWVRGRLRLSYAVAESSTTLTGTDNDAQNLALRYESIAFRVEGNSNKKSQIIQNKKLILFQDEWFI